MKTPIVICLLTLASFAQAEPPHVKAELVLNSAGVRYLIECGTQRPIELGGMATTPYFYLLKRYEEISNAGKNPVIVEVEGVLVRSSSGKLQLDSPRFISITQGKCN